MISIQKIKEARDFLRDFFDLMDVPEDDDGLVDFIISKFENLEDHYDELLNKYEGNNYPDKKKIIEAKATVSDLLYAKTDNIALVNKLIDMEDELEDMQEDMESIEDFFKSQVDIFDEATRLESLLRSDLDYLQNESEVNDALNKIRLIVNINPKKDNFDYRDVPRLNEYMKVVRVGHNRLLDGKREEILEIVRQCMEEIHRGDKNDSFIWDIIKKTDAFYTQKKKEITETESLRILDGFIPSLWSEKDQAVKDIIDIEKSNAEAERRHKDEKERQSGENGLVKETEEKPKTQEKKHIKKFYRQALFPARTLENEAEIREYLETIERSLMTLLGDCDGIEIN